jgi:hypothetical protein
MMEVKQVRQGSRRSYHPALRVVAGEGFQHSAVAKPILNRYDDDTKEQTL